MPNKAKWKLDALSNFSISVSDKLIRLIGVKLLWVLYDIGRFSRPERCKANIIISSSVYLLQQTDTYISVRCTRICFWYRRRQWWYWSCGTGSRHQRTQTATLYQICGGMSADSRITSILHQQKYYIEYYIVKCYLIIHEGLLYLKKYSIFSIPSPTQKKK